MEIRGFEPLTPGLQSRCSSQLSYIPSPFTAQGKKESRTVSKHSRADSILRRIRFARVHCAPLFPWKRR